jgi:hypothetical protein
MRALTQPKVLRHSVTAAAITSLLCLPRLSLWSERRHPLWYLEMLLLLGGTVLWAFVFAWHTRYTGQPVFRLKIEPGIVVPITLIGLGTAASLLFLLDPRLRIMTPADYPKSPQEWAARTLFSLAFTQVFLVFAPFAWLMRLFRDPKTAIGLTVLFGLFVMVVKNHSAPTPLPLGLFSGLLALRVITGLLSIYCYLRGGALLVWWWTLLLESRHLVSL